MLPLLSSLLVYVFSSLPDTVILGLDCSSAFLECGNLASRTTVSLYGLSHLSTIPQYVLSTRSTVRRCIALRMTSPPWMPLEDARDGPTRGECVAVVPT